MASVQGPTHVVYRLRSNQPDELITAMLWSIITSPTPRYVAIHDRAVSLLVMVSDLRLGLCQISCLPIDAEGGFGAYVRPVERFTPARKADTGSSQLMYWVKGVICRTQHRIKGVVCQAAELDMVSDFVASTCMHTHNHI